MDWYGCPSIPEPEQVSLPVVDEGGIPPAVPPTFHLELVEGLGGEAALFGFEESREPRGHPRIVPSGGRRTTGGRRVHRGKYPCAPTTFGVGLRPLFGAKGQPSRFSGRTYSVFRIPVSENFPPIYGG